LSGEGRPKGYVNREMPEEKLFKGNLRRKQRGDVEGKKRPVIKRGGGKRNTSQRGKKKRTSNFT